MGNKVDLVEGNESARQVSHGEAIQWAQENGVEYLETSAKSGQNVEAVRYVLLTFFFSAPNSFVPSFMATGLHANGTDDS